MYPWDGWNEKQCHKLLENNRDLKKLCIYNLNGKKARRYGGALQWNTVVECLIINESTLALPDDIDDITPMYSSISENENLQTFHLQDIEDYHVSQVLLAAASANPFIKNVKLWKMKMNCDFVTNFIASTCFIETINFRRIDFQPPFLDMDQNLRRAFQSNTSLKHIVLTAIHKHDLEEIIEALSGSPSLHELKIQSSFFSLKCLLSFLGKTTSLKSLILNKNTLQEDMIDSSMEVFRENVALHSLSLSGINNSALKVFLRGVRESRNLQHLVIDNCSDLDTETRDLMKDIYSGTGATSIETFSIGRIVALSKSSVVGKILANKSSKSRLCEIKIALDKEFDASFPFEMKHIFIPLQQSANLKSLRLENVASSGLKKMLAYIPLTLGLRELTLTLSEQTTTQEYNGIRDALLDSFRQNTSLCCSEIIVHNKEFASQIENDQMILNQICDRNAHLQKWVKYWNLLPLEYSHKVFHSVLCSTVPENAHLMRDILFALMKGFWAERIRPGEWNTQRRSQDKCMEDDGN